jgi:hypothetical protein
MMTMTTNEVAGPGEVFVCSACGRRSKDRDGNQKIHSGWDTSCRTHAVKCREEDLVLDPQNGTVKALKKGATPIPTKDPN